MTPTRIIIEKDKSEEETENSNKLNEFVRRKATNEITIDEASLLLECMGCFIDNLSPGVAELLPNSKTEIVW